MTLKDIVARLRKRIEEQKREYRLYTYRPLDGYDPRNDSTERRRKPMENNL
jgi:hypothetical protein